MIAAARKRSIALVVREPGRTGGERWLLVRRPPDDPELPGVWGLPAGSHRPGETVEDLVRRIGRDKLHVELAPGRVLEEGDVARSDHELSMRLVAADLVWGTPRVPGADRDVTQYVEWRWGAPADLGEGADRGSLCCRLGLRAAGLG